MRKTSQIILGSLLCLSCMSEKLAAWDQTVSTPQSYNDSIVYFNKNGGPGTINIKDDLYFSENAAQITCSGQTLNIVGDNGETIKGATKYFIYTGGGSSNISISELKIEEGAGILIADTSSVTIAANAYITNMDVLDNRNGKVYFLSGAVENQQTPFPKYYDGIIQNNDSSPDTETLFSLGPNMNLVLTNSFSVAGSKLEGTISSNGMFQSKITSTGDISNTKNLIIKDITLDFTKSIGGNGSIYLENGSLKFNASQISLDSDKTIYFQSSGGSLLTPFSTTISNPIVLNTGTNIIDVGSAATAVFSGAFSGNGGIIKKGTGTLLLKGSSKQYTGITDITAGTTILETNTTLYKSGGVGTVTIAKDSTLTGNSATTSIINGNITVFGLLNGSMTVNGTVTVKDGGVNYTGQSIGQMTFTNLEIEPNGQTVIFLDGTASSLLTVSDSLTLDPGAILDLDFGPDFIPGGTVDTFLNYGSRSGTFSSIRSNSLWITGTVAYGPNSATVTITYNPLTSLGLTGNAKSVAQAIDKIGSSASASSAFLPAISVLTLATKEQISSALTQMQPAFFKGMTIAQETNVVKVQDTLSLRLQRELDRVNCYKIDKAKEADKSQTIERTCQNEVDSFHVWVNGMGDSLSQHSNTYAESPQVGYHNNMTGVVTGADYHFANYFYLGALGAYTDSKVKWVENQGNGTAKSGYGGLYFSAMGQMFYANASVIGSWNSFHEHRNILLKVENFTASNKHGGSQILSHIDTGINLGWRGFTIRPFDSFEYIAQKENSFKENGAGKLDLSVRKSNAILLRNELGLNFSGCFCIASSQWTVSPKISWVRETRIKGSHYTAEFTGTGVPFTVTGYFPNRSLVSPGISMTGSMLDDLLTVGLYYNGEFKGGYSDHSYGGEVRFGF